MRIQVHMAYGYFCAMKAELSNLKRDPWALENWKHVVRDILLKVCELLPGIVQKR